MSSEERGLRGMIRILTTVLQGIRPRDRQGPPQQGISDSTETFVHLSHLLNNGSPHAIAVTGAAGHPTSQVFLVAPSSDQTAPVRIGHPYSTLDLVAKEVSELEWTSTTVQSSQDIRTLAEKLLGILRKLGSLPPSEMPQYVVEARRWFLRTCWEGYHFRMMRTLEKEWAESPIEAMAAWTPPESDHTTLRNQGLEREHYHLMLPEAHRVNFKYMKYTVVGSNVKVPFYVDEAVYWVRLIAAILRQCRADLGSSATSKGEPVGFDTSADLLPLLAMLLRFKPIEAIFTRTSLRLMFKRSNKNELAELQEGNESGLAGDVLEILSDDDRCLESVLGIHEGLLVFRFLQTLVAPYRALDHLVKRSAHFQENVRVTLIQFPAPPEQDTGAGQGHDMSQKMRDMLRQAVKDERPWLKEEDLDLAFKWIEARLAKTMGTQLGNVHAEAGIMALACHEAPGFMNLEPGKPLPIGISTKCCWTCRKLYQLLQSRDNDHHFDLPGSHGTIHAWSPPEFGIPVAVLRDLLRELLKEAGKAAVATMDEQKSRASSPASASSAGIDIYVPVSPTKFVDY